MCYLVAMVENAEKDNPHGAELKGLLGRGSAMLTLATVAYARGFRPYTPGQWAVLSKEMQAAVEQILAAIAANPFSEGVSLALKSALTPSPHTALPEWLLPVYREPKALSFLGRQLESERLFAALGELRAAPSDREKGLAAVALALCRLQDTLYTLSCRLPSTDEERMLMRMGRLAYVRAIGGEPSAMRAKIRKLLKGASWEG